MHPDFPVPDKKVFFLKRARQAKSTFFASVFSSEIPWNQIKNNSVGYYVLHLFLSLVLVEASGSGTGT